MLINFFRHQPRAGAAHLRLDLPVRKERADDGFDTQPRSVRDWVANLPMANIGETGRQVLHALTEVNRTQMSARSRFQFLEQVRAPAHHVAQSLKKHYVGLSFPLPEESAKVASLAWVLQSEMALGYKIVIEEAVSHVSPLNRKHLVTAIYRAIRSLSRAIIISCDTYTPTPACVWSELNRLYRYAEQNRLHALSVHDVEGKSMQYSSIEDAYKQILLLALTDPYRLPQTELEGVYAALEQWAEYVTLAPATDPSAPRIFMVNLERDEPAGFFTLNHGRLESCRLIDTTRLVGFLQEQLSKPPSENIANRSSVAGLSRSTLERLHLAWRAKYGRKDPRIEKQRPVEVVLGLTALHHFVGEQVKARRAPHQATRQPSAEAQAGRPQAQDEALSLDIAEQQTQERVEAPELTHLGLPRTPAEVTVRLDDIDPETLWPLHQPNGDAPAVHCCQIVDEATGGCRLRWGMGVRFRIQVGDLAGIRSAQGGGVLWMIGAVRWIRQIANAVEVGVQWLGSSVSAAAVWTWSPTDAGSSRRLRGLVLPVGSMNNQLFHLFTAPLPYRMGDQITLSAGRVEKRVRLTQVLEMTTSFAQFEFASVESQAPSPDGPAKGGVQELLDSFAPLWTKL